MPSVTSVVVTSAVAPNSPIAGAIVTLWDQKLGSDARITDGNGFCNFGNFQSPAITMSVVAPKCEPVGQFVTSDGALAVQLPPR